MAIFEQQTAKKVLLDDTEAISCFIENWREVNGHTVSQFIVVVIIQFENLTPVPYLLTGVHH